LFDIHPDVIGKRVGELIVLDMSDLRTVVREQKIDIGILAVPSSAAQVAVDELVASGIGGLLNLACAHIHVPNDVAVVDTRILEGLQELCYVVHENKNSGGGQVK
jgi:redox-sensing transcriptional repressor